MVAGLAVREAILEQTGIAADLLESKGFKIAGAIGAQVYESEGGKLIKYAPEKPAATENK